MKIGIISDIHENLRHLDIVREKLTNQRIEMLLFCGDFVMPFVMRGFVKFNCPIKAVLGNGDPDILKFYYILEHLEVLKNLDIDIKEHFQDIKIDNRRIAIFHGNEDSLTKALIESQMYDLLCIGHTHIPEISQEGKTLIVNPGSLIGWFQEKGGKVPITYAIYDSDTNKAKLFEVE